MTNPTPTPYWPRSTVGMGRRRPLSSYTQLTDDGATAAGCWIYCGVHTRRGESGRSSKARNENRARVAAEWGWAWPADQQCSTNQASADPDGKPWSERKALVWWDAEKGKWTGHDVPDFVADRAPSYRPPDGATGVAAISGDRSVHHASRRQSVAVRARSGWPTDRCPRTTSLRSRPYREPALRAAPQPDAHDLRASRQPLPPQRWSSPARRSSRSS